MAESYSQNQKYEVLLCGMKYGVSEACRTYGVSKTIYYRWKNRFESEGINGLEARPQKGGKCKIMSPELEHTILSAIRLYPQYGPRSIAWLIQDDGNNIGENTVYRIMKKHELTTRKKREDYSRGSVENKYYQPKTRMTAFKKLFPGDGWICWTIFWGRLPRLGRIYQYFVIDARSGFAASALDTIKSRDTALDLILGTALPISLNLGLKTPKWVVTQNENEYTNGRTNSMHQYTATLRDLGIKQYGWDEVPSSYLQAVNPISKRFQQELFPLALTDNCTLAFLKQTHRMILRDYNFNKTSPVSPNQSKKTPFELFSMHSTAETNPPAWLQIELLHE